MDHIPFDMNPRQPRENAAPRRAGGRPPIGRVVLAVIVLLLLFFGGALLRLWVDWRWFGEVGYTRVFWTLTGTRWALGAIFALVMAAILVPNIVLALRFAPPPAIPLDLRGQAELLARRSLGPLLYGAVLFVTFFGGVAAANQWNEYLLFRNAVPFDRADALFGHDIGFYIFRLPFINFGVGYLMSAVVLALAGVVLVYAVALTRYYDPVRGWNVAGHRVPPGAAAHASILVAIFLLLKALDYWLKRYGLLYGISDAVNGGAGYADIYARLPVLSLLAVLSVAAAAVTLAQLAFKRVLWGAFAVAGLVAVSLLGGAIYPTTVQQIRVKPNELAAEEPFIRRHTEATRHAFGLDRIQQNTFTVHNDPTPGLVARNRETIDNARLWDYGIAAQSFSQLQEIKPYYDFGEVDVDRYTLNGRYRQVLISARELNQNDLPEQSKSFQNIHLVYTHGIGFVMSPVNEVSSDGQPVFLVRGIPPRTEADLKITQTRIYFGEADQPWAAVGGETPEFDYPGEEDVFVRYSGKAGIRVGGILSRLALALYVGDQNFLLSRSITADSRLIIHRRIQDRVARVAPYLMLDNDPYPVIDDGRLVWMQDAYTTTARYPYSEPVAVRAGWSYPAFNYIRNSVKAVVDAYDGSVSLYAVDPDDPILAAYGRAFPNTFLPVEDMPEPLRAHMRYPEDLFEIQSRKFLLYHMTDPKTFYSGEDAWDIPRLSQGTVGEGRAGNMEAYYVMTRLPGSTKQEMVMIRPFTPRAKNNMVAWMAARCDPPHYGEVVVFRFPMDSLPLGPAQVEASIRQKPEISKELTLLNQQGSQAILGNMLTIPVERSLLYIQPLYVQTANRGFSRADVARVIVSYGERVAMRETLAQALNAVFGSDISSRATGVSGAAGQTAAPPAGGTGGRADAVDRAVRAFDRAQEAQKQGDWAGYGAALKDLEQALQRLKQESR